VNEVIKFLEENPIQYLATVGKDAKPKVRPFQYMLERGGKLYFCTSNQKDVYKEIKNSPYVELCACTTRYAWVRLSGKVEFSNDIAIKAAILEKSPLVKSIYKAPDNPAFEIFYLKEAIASISDFSGQPPKQYQL
jgi:uncharacterized pyridoxamine 5'-phosphate oxidase family protein